MIAVVAIAALPAASATNAWAATGPAALSWSPDGSTPQPIVTGQTGPEDVAVDSSHLYWTNYNDGTIWEANLDGSNPQTIVTDQGVNPRGLAVGP